MKETHIILQNQTMAADDEVSVRRPTADSGARHSIQHGSRGIVGPQFVSMAPVGVIAPIGYDCSQR